MNIQKKLRFYKKAAIGMLALFTYQLVFPTVALALTTGPSQPEVHGFEPAGTTQMVDLFSGDFTYNIPLFELPGPDGGYPFNLAYHSGISMDQEASWVGLGWSLTPGAINRNMRGLPDDFNGDEISVTQDMKPNRTIIGELRGELELFGLSELESLQTLIDGETLKTIADVQNAISNGTLEPPGPTPTGTFNLSGKVMYNNYKGFGVSMDPGFSLGMGGFKADLGLSFNSFEGVGLNVGVGYSLDDNVSLYGGLNKRAAQGMGNPNFGLSIAGTAGEGKKAKKFQGALPYSSMLLTHSDQAYMPPSDMAWASADVSLSAHGGLDVFGLDGGFEVGGMYSSQWVSNKDEDIKAYGYLNLENAPEDGLKDFNREKDGPVYPLTPNLAAPMMTSDVYSVAGQGVGGLYRAHRSDIGIIGDRKVVSYGGGAAIKAEGDAGFLSGKIGVDADVNMRRSVAGMWDKHQGTSLDFQGKDDVEDLPDYEPYYFKAAGEMTGEEVRDYDNIGGDLPVVISNSGSSDMVRFGNSFKNIVTEDENLLRQKRKPRQSSIQPIKNKELLDNSSQEKLSEYDVGYYPSIPSGGTLYDENSIVNFTDDVVNPAVDAVARNRNKYKDHIAGFTALQANGMRYVYGLPAYNLSKDEYVFSVDGSGLQCGPTVPVPTKVENGETVVDYKQDDTNEYFKKTSVPAYTHANLLTSVLGADYVDVNNNGPDDEDYGYWIKFNYVKTENYNWRSPYFDANLMQGLRNIKKDDKGSFVYGEREQYYMATVETKTHIAMFEISPREDARGAVDAFQTTTTDLSSAARSYKLDRIKLFSKMELENNPTNPTPIKTIELEYDEEFTGNEYTLCEGVDNNAHPTQTGKLTLQRVWFKNQNNTRGSLSPYKFEYNNNSTYDYDVNKYDKWGNFKDNDGTPDGECKNLHFPYVDQFDKSMTFDAFRTTADAHVAAWNLSKIHMPSGATIEVEYEMDDYAYEQNRVATQMFKVADVDASPGTQDLIPHGIATDGNNRKIIFDLEHNIPNTSTADAEVEQLYTGDLHIDEEGYKQLYFKFLMNLKQDAEDAFEFVEGYAQIEEVGATTLVGGEYTQGYIQLRGVELELKGGTDIFHPISAAAWQFLRTQLPDKIHADQSLDGEPGSGQEKIQKLVSLAGMWDQLLGLFTGYYTECLDNDYGLEVDLDNSYIKLNSPDKLKLGGGLRVKQITLDDHWDPTGNEIATLGQVYDYTTTDEDGNTISSGVVTKEPMVGGEESALRYGKPYPQRLMLDADNNYYFEGPINENYYPGPSVGYSKVTVKSLATHYAMNPGSVPSGAVLPSGFATTGVTVNEFYTAKDFPVITRETIADNDEFRPSVIPLIFATIRLDLMSATQGYTIELNDMHGKPFRTTHYALDDLNQVIPQYVSKTVYNYFEQETPQSYQGREIRVLDNVVPVILSDKGTDATKAEFRGKDDPNAMQLGVDYEFFTDMRQDKSTQSSVGFQFNANVAAGAPIFTGYPSLNYSQNRLRTAVTNKVIRRTGIIKSVDVYDESSKVTTENKLFDALSGQPLLTTVQNNFDDLVYNYQIPARWEYDGMGAAYENWGMKLKISGSLTTVTGCNGNVKLNKNSLLYNNGYSGSTKAHTFLNQGDEFIASSSSGVPLGKITFIEKIGNDLYFNAESSVTGSYLQLYLVRSGKRNHLTVPIASVTALENPTVGRSTVVTNGTVDAPSASGTTSKTYDITTYANSGVLSSSATVFKDAWAVSDDVECGTATNNNPYATGEKGIWRPYQSFAYVTDRKASLDATLPDDVVDLETGGTYDLTMFNWENPFFTECNNHDWKLTNEITQYSRSGHELENRNILGHYSAALYGYGDNLTTAVASNARYSEIAFDGFEEYTIDDLGSLVNENVSSHLDIVGVSACASPVTTVPETFTIISDMNITGSGTQYAIINKEYVAGTTPDRATLSVIDENGVSHQTSVNLAGSTPLTSYTLPSHYNAYYDMPNMTKVAFTNNCLTAGHYRGQITLEYDVTPPTYSGTTGIAISDERAHTGKQSLKLNGSKNFNLNTLQLEVGKEYVFSAWVSEQDDNHYQFNHHNLTVCGTAIPVTGKVIDGWQRIEGVFTADATKLLEINAGIVYFDDIRIFPKDAAIQTYVYDPANYRLKATLDNNNYATFYNYDEEGRLIGIKKETKDGVMSLQEARSYVKGN